MANDKVHTTKIEATKEQTVKDVIKKVEDDKDFQIGIERIEFPDGSILEMGYNGEKDRQAGLKYVRMCSDAANGNSCKARYFIQTVYRLVAYGYTIDEIVNTDYGECFIDIKRKTIVDSMGNVMTQLPEDDKETEATTIVVKLMQQLQEE